jgi:hypothetical protein
VLIKRAIGDELMRKRRSERVEPGEGGNIDWPEWMSDWADGSRRICPVGLLHEARHSKPDEFSGETDTSGPPRAHGGRGQDSPRNAAVRGRTQRHKRRSVWRMELPQKLGDTIEEQPGIIGRANIGRPNAHEAHLVG